MNSKAIEEFQKTVLHFWQKNGRHQLPWRKTTDPYKIFLSEMMLQQTQVERVIPYYKNFLKKYPTVKKLALSQLRDVLKKWDGLGYNRRAKYIRDTAIAVVKNNDGKFPRRYDELRKLPGIGDYTARAVRVFVFNEPDILVETNIRTAYLHAFYSNVLKNIRINDGDIVPLAVQAAKGQDPREWHWALMDYGAFLKKSGVRLNHLSTHYKSQSPFEGSLRQMRGKLLRRLTEGPITKESFKKIDAKNAYTISMALKAMEREGLVKKHKEKWEIA